MWATKHTPVNWAQFLGNNAAISRAKAWVQNFPGTDADPSHRVLLLSGPEGCGKSCAAVMLLAGYRIFRYTLQDIKSHKKDSELLNNFCELYRSDRQTFNGTGVRHAIVIDDFESVTKADATFHATLVKLVTEKPPQRPPPIILTVTTMPFVSEKKRTKGYQGLAKIATEVILAPMKNADLITLVERTAAAEKVTIENKVATLIADNAQGDARKAIQTLEIMAKGAPRITNEKALEWIDNNSNDNDEKMAYDVRGSEGSSTRHGVASDEDRIIQVALTHTDPKVAAAATRVVVDNSKTFMPLLFQVYPGFCGMKRAASIADDFSFNDVVSERGWMGGTSGNNEEMSSTSDVMAEIPMRRIAALRGLRGNRDLTVRTNGYQTYYGYENTAKSQSLAAENVRSHHEDLYHTSPEGLLTLQSVVASVIDDDERLMAVLKAYNLPPSELDNLAKLKGNEEVDISMPRRRKTHIAKLWEKHVEAVESAPTVKFIEPVTRPRKQTDDPFALNWD